jgi:hypothetical protein
LLFKKSGRLFLGKGKRTACLIAVIVSQANSGVNSRE